MVTTWTDPVPLWASPQFQFHAVTTPTPVPLPVPVLAGPGLPATSATSATEAMTSQGPAGWSGWFGELAIERGVAMHPVVYQRRRVNSLTDSQYADGGDLSAKISDAAGSILQATLAPTSDDGLAVANGMC